MCIPKRLDLPKRGGTLVTMVDRVILGNVAIAAIIAAHDCIVLYCDCTVLW